MLYTSLHESPRNKSKPGKTRPKMYSYGGWEFASFDDEAVASFLDDDESQNVADDDTLTEPSLVDNQLATVHRVRASKKKSNAVRSLQSGVNKTMNSSSQSRFTAKKRRAEFNLEEGSVETGVGGKRSKISPKSAKLQKLVKKVNQHAAEKGVAASITVDGRSIGPSLRPRFVSPSVSGRVPRLRAVGEIVRPVTTVQHRPLVRPIRSSELGIQPRTMWMPSSGPRPGARTIAEITAAQSSSPVTPILEKLSAPVLASPSLGNAPSRLTQIVSSISALQNTNISSSPNTIHYVITTNGRPAAQPVRQTPTLLVGSSSLPASVGGNIRPGVIYQVPAAGHHPVPLQTSVQSVSTVRPAQTARLILPSSTSPLSAAAKQSFVLTAPGGDRQSFLLLPTSNRQSYILAPATSSVTSAVSAATSGVVRPTNLAIQMSPPRPPRPATVQQLIQPAPVQRTIHLAPSPRIPVADTPILEKLALQLNSAQPAVAARYEVVAQSGELIAATSPAKAQIIYPTISPPSQIVRLSGSPGPSPVQLVNHMVVGASAAKPVQTITMPQLVVRQPRPVAPVSSVTPAVLPVAGPRIVSGTNLVQVPTTQLSTVIIVDSSSSPGARHS